MRVRLCDVVADGYRTVRVTEKERERERERGEKRAGNIGGKESKLVVRGFWAPVHCGNSARGWRVRRGDVYARAESAAGCVRGRERQAVLQAPME